MNERPDFSPDPSDVQAKLDQADNARTAAQLSRDTSERMQEIADNAYTNSGAIGEAPAVDPTAAEHRAIAAKHEGAAYKLQADAEAQQEQQQNEADAELREITHLQEHRVARDVAHEPDGTIVRDENGFPERDAA